MASDSSGSSASDDGMVALLHVNDEDMVMFSAAYDDPFLPADLNVCGPTVAALIGIHTVRSERYYRTRFLGEHRGVVDEDVRGYSAEIVGNLRRVAAALKRRRKRRCTNYEAIVNFNVIPPKIENLGEFDEILDRERPVIRALVAEAEVQIKTRRDFDAALHLIRGNTVRENLPLFLVSNDVMFFSLPYAARGLYRAVRKVGGIWQMEAVFNGGNLPVAGAAAVAVGDDADEGAAAAAAVADADEGAGAVGDEDSDGEFMGDHHILVEVEEQQEEEEEEEEEGEEVAEEAEVDSDAPRELDDD